MAPRLAQAQLRKQTPRPSRHKQDEDDSVYDVLGGGDLQSRHADGEVD
jgi:hypothetical protein